MMKLFESSLEILMPLVVRLDRFVEVKYCFGHIFLINRIIIEQNLMCLKNT